LITVGIAVALLSFLLPCACAQQAAPQSDKQTPSQAAGLPSGLSGEQIVERVSPSVVLILVGEGGEQLSAVGSGVIVKPDGVLLTALHLVKGADTVQVRLKNGDIYDRVELIGSDDRRDVAALHITASGLPAVSVAGTSEVKPGQTVMVVSNPGGLAWSASSGVLSAQRLADEIPGAGTGYRLLQFTAPVSPGSSGGVLVDGEGRALGIVIASRGGQNLNFAVPVESVLGLVSGTTRLAFRSGSELRLQEGEKVPTPPAAAPFSAGTPQPGQTGTLQSARRLFFYSKEGQTFEFPTEPVLKKLLEQPEFKNGDLVIVTSRSDAELVVELARKPWTWDFTYLMTHPASGAVVGSGKVVAWDGVRAAPGIASQIVKRLRELRGTAQSGKKRR
jgi:S1-C subfamily serine protease